MLSQEELEKVVWARVRTWEDELYHEYLVRQIPHRSPYWRRWTAGGLASLGVRLTHVGQWLTQRAYAASASLVTETAGQPGRID